jgi:small subunit ribosomal protein S6
VKRFDKGYYVLLDFCGFPEMVTELERNLKLDDRILKYSTVKSDEDVDPAELIVKEEKTEDNTGNQVEEKQIESAEEA